MKTVIWWILALVIPASIAQRTVTLKIYDQHGRGKELVASSARSLMGGAKHWDSDALVNPVTLLNIGAYPLYPAGHPARLRFDISASAAALAVAWPTSRGYSYWILDNGGNGFNSSVTVVFNLQAAEDAKRRLDEALAARPAYVQSASFQNAYLQANRRLSLARSASTDSERGRYGQLALDAINGANDALLSEYGSSNAYVRNGTPWCGLTVDNPKIYPKWPELAAQITQPRGWVRLVFDPTIDRGHPSYYATAVDAAHKAGLKVLGQPIDSSFANSYTRASYLARFKKYVDAYPTVEAWEVGNEVNGCWVDSQTDKHGDCTKTLLPADDRIANKIADAAAYIRNVRPAAEVVLTLYWQIGTDLPQWSTFNWARGNLPMAVRRDIDVVLLSTYVEDAPMGAAFDTVMTALHAEFPRQRVGIGELDYWAKDTSRNWWAFNKNDTLAARSAVASYYYSAQLGYDFANGGGFWWYAVEEMPDNPELQAAIRNVASLEKVRRSNDATLAVRLNWSMVLCCCAMFLVPMSCS